MHMGISLEQGVHRCWGGDLEGKQQSLHEQWNLCVQFKESLFCAQYRRRQRRCGKREQQGGIKGLIRYHQLMMKEAHFVRSWEMLLLKAKLKDTEGAIIVLERKIHPKQSIDGRDWNNDGQEGGRWSPLSLLLLRRVCMDCRPGDFVAIVKGVGVEKSTLINSILGKGRPLTGMELAMKGKLGTFLQMPLIVNNTVRENILSGCLGGINEERYQLALQVCFLGHNLKLLPHGDKTKIGEKGITLLRGQKARVAFVRAVYHDADINLLDDPLAAVDACIGKDLFNKCIVNELLLGKSKAKTQTGWRRKDVGCCQ
jgi:ABC-type lipoprotein export system ATPase subunit